MPKNGYISGTIFSQKQNVLHNSFMEVAMSAQNSQGTPKTLNTIIPARYGAGEIRIVTEIDAAHLIAGGNEPPKMSLELAKKWGLPYVQVPGIEYALPPMVVMNFTLVRQVPKPLEDGSMDYHFIWRVDMTPLTESGLKRFFASGEQLMVVDGFRQGEEMSPLGMTIVPMEQALDIKDALVQTLHGLSKLRPPNGATFQAAYAMGKNQEHHIKVSGSLTATMRRQRGEAKTANHHEWAMWKVHRSVFWYGEFAHALMSMFFPAPRSDESNVSPWDSNVLARINNYLRDAEAQAKQSSLMVWNLFPIIWVLSTLLNVFCFPKGLQYVTQIPERDAWQDPEHEDYPYVQDAKTRMLDVIRRIWKATFCEIAELRGELSNRHGWNMENIQQTVSIEIDEALIRAGDAEDMAEMLPAGAIRALTLHPND